MTRHQPEQDTVPEYVDGPMGGVLDNPVVCTDDDSRHEWARRGVGRLCGTYLDYADAMDARFETSGAYRTAVETILQERGAVTEGFANYVYSQLIPIGRRMTTVARLGLEDAPAGSIEATAQAMMLMRMHGYDIIDAMDEKASSACNSEAQFAKVPNPTTLMASKLSVALPGSTTVERLTAPKAIAVAESFYQRADRYAAELASLYAANGQPCDINQITNYLSHVAYATTADLPKPLPNDFKELRSRVIQAALQQDFAVAERCLEDLFLAFPESVNDYTLSKLGLSRGDRAEFIAAKRLEQQEALDALKAQAEARRQVVKNNVLTNEIISRENETSGVWLGENAPRLVGQWFSVAPLDEGGVREYVKFGDLTSRMPSTTRYRLEVERICIEAQAYVSGEQDAIMREKMGGRVLPARVVQMLVEYGFLCPVAPEDGQKLSARASGSPDRHKTHTLPQYIYAIIYMTQGNPDFQGKLIPKDLPY